MVFEAPHFDIHIESYLSTRQQYVEFNGICSESYQIHCRVPQGSILGPHLFPLYIDVLCNVSKVLTTQT